MKLILLGAPGAGKGTQAEIICEKLNIPFIGIRVISNNELTGNSDIEKQFEIAQTKLQLFIFKFLTELTDNYK